MKTFKVGETVGEIQKAGPWDLFGGGYMRCVVVDVLGDNKYNVRRGNYIWTTDGEKLVDEYTLKLHEI